MLPVWCWWVNLCFASTISADVASLELMGQLVFCFNQMVFFFLHSRRCCQSTRGADVSTGVLLPVYISRCCQCGAEWSAGVLIPLYISRCCQSGADELTGVLPPLYQQMLQVNSWRWCVNWCFASSLYQQMLPVWCWWVSWCFASTIYQQMLPVWCWWVSWCFASTIYQQMSPVWCWWVNWCFAFTIYQLMLPVKSWCYMGQLVFCFHYIRCWQSGQRLQANRRKKQVKRA